jgi:hypothetical protein
VHGPARLADDLAPEYVLQVQNASHQGEIPAHFRALDELPVAKNNGKIGDDFWRMMRI